MKNELEVKKESEARIQSKAYLWFNNTYPQFRGLLFHVPNGEKRDPITANKLKAMGVVAGIPDMIFLYRKRAYFFEFKADIRDKPSKAQVKIHKALDLQRFQIWVVWDAATFAYLIDCIIADTSEDQTLGLTFEEYDYKDKVFRYIYSQPVGVLVSLDDICTPETKQKFVHYLSEFIIEGFDTLAGFELLFTRDFKHFYKTNDSVDSEELKKRYTVSKWRQEQRESLTTQKDDQKQ